MAEKEPHGSPVRSLDEGVVLSTVIKANTQIPYEAPPPYTPAPTSSVQVAPMTATRPSISHQAQKKSSKKSCCVVSVIVFFIIILGAAAVLVWYYNFRKPEEPEIVGDIEEPGFYANVSGLRSKINLNLKFQADILTELDGKIKVAIIFLRQETKSGNGLFQVAMVAFTSTVAKLRALLAPAVQSLAKATTGVDFYFQKYPVDLHLEIALGAYDQKKFIWAASVHAFFQFKSKEDGQKLLSLDMLGPHEAAEKILNKIVKQAGWTGGIVKKDSKSKKGINAQLTPGCGANYYLKDCSRYCLGKNSSEGHYTCTADGLKQCLTGWLNPADNCLDVDFCGSINCLNGGTCQNNNGTGVCLCPSGYTGQFCGSDIDECANGTRCFNGGTCRNTNGSFECLCPSSVKGKDCSVDVNECLKVGLCKNGGTCSNVHGSYKCTCLKTFKGTHCETKTLASTVKPSMAVSLGVIVALLVFRWNLE